MTPAQCRAARGFLNISQYDLAIAAGIKLSVVQKFECGRDVPLESYTAAIKAAFEARGVRFVYCRNRTGAYGLLYSLQFASESPEEKDQD